MRSGVDTIENAKRVGPREVKEDVAKDDEIPFTLRNLKRRMCNVKGLEIKFKITFLQLIDLMFDWFDVERDQSQKTRIKSKRGEEKRTIQTVIGRDKVWCESGTKLFDHLRDDVDPKVSSERRGSDLHHLFHPVEITASKIENRSHLVGVQKLRAHMDPSQFSPTRLIRRNSIQDVTSVVRRRKRKKERGRAYICKEGPQMSGEAQS